MPSDMSDRLFTFHPRILALMAGVMGLSLLAVFGVIWIRLPADARDSFSWFQRLTLIAFFGAVFWILYRMTTLRVTASGDDMGGFTAGTKYVVRVGSVKSGTVTADSGGNVASTLAATGTAEVQVKVSPT